MNAWFWKERLTTQRRLQEGQLDGPQAYGVILLPVLLTVAVVAPPAVFILAAAYTVVLTTIYALKCTCSVFTSEREWRALLLSVRRPSPPVASWLQSMT